MSFYGIKQRNHFAPEENELYLQSSKHFRARTLLFVLTSSSGRLAPSWGWSLSLSGCCTDCEASWAMTVTLLRMCWHTQKHLQKTDYYHQKCTSESNITAHISLICYFLFFCSSLKKNWRVQLMSASARKVWKPLFHTTHDKTQVNFPKDRQQNCV